jgi:hypothetical protein
MRHFAVVVWHGDLALLDPPAIVCRALRPMEDPDLVGRPGELEQELEMYKRGYLMPLDVPAWRGRRWSYRRRSCRGVGGAEPAHSAAQGLVDLEQLGRMRPFSHRRARYRRVDVC